MKLKFISIAIALLFIIMLAPSSQATYSLSLTGAVDFQTDPWVNETFHGYVVVGLGNQSQSSLDVVLSVSGEIVPWLTWTESNTFVLYPDQQRIVHFEIDFPASAPDEYSGGIAASASPSSTTQSGGAAVPGNMAVAIGVSIMIPARVYFKNVYADGIGAASEVFNGHNSTFSGNVTYNLTESNTGLEKQVVNITNLGTNQSIVNSAIWNTTLALGVDYDVIFTLMGPNNTLVDRKVYSFRLPTPADILAIWHSPGAVYEDYDATIYARVIDQSGVTQCTAHYVIDGGAEQTVLMDFDINNKIYLALIDNVSYHAGSFVDYWVTSHYSASGNVYDGISQHNNFRVYSSTAPDLAIDGASVVFSPSDPRTVTMYDSNVTNIFVTVQNIGRGEASNIAVEMYDYNNSLDRKNIFSLPSGTSYVIRFNLNQPAVGAHLLRFVVDPDDNITEINENNNYISVEISVSATPAPPTPPPEEPAATTSLLPYVIIPIVVLVLLLLLLFFRRKKTINVMVSAIKPYKNPKDGSMRWIYTCSYGGEVVTAEKAGIQETVDEEISTDDAERQETLDKIASAPGQDKVVTDGHVIGTTKSTTIKADIGVIINVKVSEVIAKSDGSLRWVDAIVVKIGDEEDSEEKIRKLVKSRKD